jgi:hypothetical protein
MATAEELGFQPLRTLVPRTLFVYPFMQPLSTRNAMQSGRGTKVRQGLKPKTIYAEPARLEAVP